MEKTQVNPSQLKALHDRLAAWDSHLAPLSDRQKEAFVELSSAAASRPLPSQVHIHCNHAYFHMHAAESHVAETVT